ncbi:MAG TPA: S1C family serine protease [Pirellulales bacterium]
MVTRRLSTGRSVSLLLILVAGLLSAFRLATIAADEPPMAENQRAPTGASISLDSVSNTAVESTPGKTAAKPLVTVKNLPTTAGDLATLQAGIQQAVEKARPATVGISIRGSFGSGVIVTEDGYVLTAGHVVAAPGREATVIFPDGKRVKAKTLGVNREMDSGMLKIIDEGKYPHVEMGRSGDLKLGQWCITLGHPGGFIKDRPPVVRVGRILNLYNDAIWTDCTIVGGDSGGPLVDMAGRVIGIHSRISDDVTDNYHVPIDTFRDTWARLVKGDTWGGPPSPGGPLLGINGRTAPPSGPKGAGGCRVTDIFPSTPADLAGIARDDIITSFGGEAVTSLDGLQALIAKHKVGDEVTIVIQRDGEKRELKVKLGERE